MLPTLALIGRPNVGKSTLFNRITGTRDAIVANYSGLTRDRQYGEASFDGRSFFVIDTGGIGQVEADIDAVMGQQTQEAIKEADVFLFIVDGRAGLTEGDRIIAQQLRQINKPLLLVVNKTDGVNEDVAIADFYELGLGEPIPIAASHGRGTTQLMHTVMDTFPPVEETEEELDTDEGIKLAIVGRPNVGKSTLVNRMLGEDRVVVFDMPGTTRDSIKVPLIHRDKRYTLVDTAGIRRKGKVDLAIEKFSIIKTLQSIEQVHVVMVVLDASEGVTEQDLHILGYALDAGKSLIVILNKWDGLDNDHRDYVKKELLRRLDFVTFAKIHFISALHGTGVGDLYASIDACYASAFKEISTADLNRVFEKAVADNPTPMVHGRRIKLRYAHVGGHNPPTIVIHGNQTEYVPENYKRYLMSTFRKAFKLVGTPIRLNFVTSDNPYKHKKNVLTYRQMKKRERNKTHYNKD